MKNILPSLRRSLILQVLILASLLPGLSLFTVPLQANPSGAAVVHGNVSMSGLGTSQLDIVQSSQAAVINWQSFSIQAGETTNFIQPNQNAIALNRVVGVDPSLIYGTLTANGGVIVVNNNGIVVGPGGRVDVAGMLTMSTLDVGNDDFLNGGPMRFQGSSSAGIKNYGAISSASGDVVLLGNFLQNSGQVSAATGTVAFGAGGDIVVNQTASGGKISVLAGGIGGENGIENSAAGEINGAAAELKAHGNVYALAIKNDGVVRASGYNFSGGRLTLSGGSNSRVMNTGNLYARNSDGSGGRVDVSGGDVSLAGGTINASGAAGMNGGSVAVSGDTVDVGNGAMVDVSGSSAGSVSVIADAEATVNGHLSAVGRDGSGGNVDVTAQSVVVGSSAYVNAGGTAEGGDVRIGGGYQGNEADLANAETTVVEAGSLILADSWEGDAGRVIVWADADTTFDGEISVNATGAVGNGGFVEVSGKQNLLFFGDVSMGSANGSNGTLLLDPANVTIGGASATITTLAITTALDTGNVVIHTSGGSPGTDGNILLAGNDPLTYDVDDNSLSLFAHGSIFINDDIQNAGSGNVTLFAGWDGTGDTSAASAISFSDIADTDNNPVVGGFGDWGNNGGSVFVNDDHPSEVAVGSAFGETNVFGSRIVVAGGSSNNRSAQIGFRDVTVTDGVASSNGDANLRGPTGSIAVRAKSVIIISAALKDPTTGRFDSYAIVGHGGVNVDDGDDDISGDISVISEGGPIILHGSRSSSFAQIGHGGVNLEGDKDGNITVEATSLDMRGGNYTNAANSSGNSGAQIGHGGYESEGNGHGYSGEINVTITGSITGTTSQNKNITSANGNMVQIGHGGYLSGAVNRNPGTEGLRDPNAYNSSIYGSDDILDNVGMGMDPTIEGHSGDVNITVGGAIDLSISSRADQHIQFGHGGRESHGNHFGKVNLDVVGGITLDRDSATIVSATAFRDDNNSFIHVGHGGNRTGGAFTGDIEIDAASFEMHATAGDSGYAQVGHGGYNDGLTGGAGVRKLNDDNAHATLSGHITINVTNDFEMYAGMAETDSYAMVGHGGTYRTAYGEVNRNLHDDITSNDGDAADIGLIDESERGHHGNITITAGGSVIAKAEAKNTADFENVSGEYNFAQIGHGGARSAGDHYGAVTVTATTGSATFQAGPGGWEIYRPNTVIGGNLDDLDGAQLGLSNYAMVGHGGYYSHLNGATDTSNSEFITDNGNHSGVGFGSITTTDITHSNIVVTSGTDINLTASQELGGFRSDQIPVDTILEIPDHAGGNPNIVAAGTTIPQSPRSLRNFALIGHGGFGHTSNVSDASATSVNRGDITLTAGGNVAITGGGVQQQDHSIIDYNTINPGNIQDGDNIVERNFAQVGHGGDSIQMAHSGNITIAAGGDVDLKGGNAYLDPARVGHGGYNSGFDAIGTTPMEGNILVTSLGDINVIGGDGSNISAGGNTQFGFAQIGHGAGANGQVVDNASITVTALNDVTVSGGDGFRDSYGHIGHGGVNNADGALSGTIDVTAGRNVILRSTSGGLVQDPTGDPETDVAGAPVVNVVAGLAAVRNFAKIGHGDTDSAGLSDSTGRWNGDIFVKAGLDVNSFGGMIGHADLTDDDVLTTSTSGDTFIAAGRNDPLGTGLGGFIFTTTAPDGSPTNFTSAGFGDFGELRLYMPSSNFNFIQAGTEFNNPAFFGTYTRNPAPGTALRFDEQVATEFTLMFDPVSGLPVSGLPNGGFTPEGTFVLNSFGTYNIFYADQTVVPVVDPGGGDTVFDFSPNNVENFIGEEQFEAFDRSDEVFNYDGYDGQLFSFGPDDSVEGEGDPATGGWFFEEMLDGALGPRRSSRSGTDADVLAGERDEELEKRKRFAARPAGRGGLTYYVFDPGTNQYSSFRVFGAPQSNLSTAQ